MDCGLKSRKGFIVLVTVSLLVTYSAAPAWVRTFGGKGDDVGTCVQLDSDSNYIITGWTESEGAGGADVWLLKVNPYSRLLWSKTYGGGLDDKGEYVLETPDGGYLIVGKTCSFGAGSWDVWLLKTDSEGNLLWSRTYGGPNEDEGRCAATNLDQGYWILANTASFGSGELDVWKIKIDLNGDTLSTNTYGGEKNDWANRYVSNSTYIAGATESQGNGEADMWLTREDFSKTFGINQWEEARDARPTALIGYNCCIIVGLTTTPNMGDDMVALLSDMTWQEVWQTKHGGIADDWANGVIEIKGHFVIVGTTYSYGSGGADLWLVCLHPAAGLCPWKKTYGGAKNDEGLFINHSRDGGCIITGYTESSGAGGKDLWLIRTNADGETLTEDLSLGESESYEATQNYKILAPLGRRIEIQHYKPLNIEIYDATGRKAEMLQVTSPGVLTWGDGIEPGVYFFKIRDGASYKTARVVVIP